jgi:hypothetical protein
MDGERQDAERFLSDAAAARERLVEEARAAYEAMVDAAKAFARGGRRPLSGSPGSGVGVLGDLQNAQGTLGRPVSTYAPELREIAVVEVIEQAVRELAGEYAREAQEARAAECEAFVSGKTKT